MQVLIVYAHPEPKSFNAALLACAKQTLSDLGHGVEIRDLYAMDFDPRTTARDFTARANPDVLRYDIEQKAAVRGGALAADVQEEIDHLLRADLIILHFPLYWFSMPAILKGWVDRVFANGVIYGDGRWYDRGALAGKRAMLTVTTGCYPSMCGPDGINGNLDMTLWPIHNGILRFVGCDVLPPFVAWSVAHKTEADRQRDLARYEARLRDLQAMAPLAFNARADFGADWRLKPGMTPAATGQKLGECLTLQANPQDFAQPGQGR